LDELQAAVLNVKLTRLQSDVAKRRELAALYDAELPPACRRFSSDARVSHGCHLYVVQVEQRDAVRAALAESGVQTGVHYPHPIHRMPAFATASPPSLVHAEQLAERVLSLPLHPRLSLVDARRVCEALQQVTSQGSKQAAHA
jgi:dTDP-4-amino-4,6-dideoxygalactose transaminase